MSDTGRLGLILVLSESVEIKEGDMVARNRRIEANREDSSGRVHNNPPFFFLPFKFGAVLCLG